MKKILHYLFYSSLLILLTSGITIAAPCIGDVIFTNITITSVATGNYQYSYTIQNIGTEDIPMNQLVIQNYVSADDQVGSDAVAGGSFIDNTSSDVLAAGETYSGIMGAYPFPANPQSSYPYLRAYIYLSSDTECDNTNNDFVTFIQVSTAIQSSLLAHATVNWIADSKSFIVNDWQGNKSGLKYSLYSSSGALLLSGHTRENESTLLEGLSKGFYLLYISDGEKVYVKKIVY